MLAMYMPDISSSNLAGIRYYSETNKWIDCLILVSAENRSKAYEEAQIGVDAYWDAHYECYCDGIEDRLKQAQIPYMLIAYDASKEDDEEYDEWFIRMIVSVENALKEPVMFLQN